MTTPKSSDAARTWVPRPPGSSSPRLDPRFQHLLTLPFERLEEIYLRERKSLRELEAQIEAETLALRRAKEREDRAVHTKRLAELYDRRFTPLTSGVHIPRLGEASDGWAPAMTEVYFSVFLLADTNVEGLSDLGVSVRSKSGNVFTGFLPFSSLELLEAADTRSVRYVELARPLFPSLDWTIDFTEIDVLHAQGIDGRMPGSTDGEGVIVGIVDDALDIHHPAFDGDPPRGIVGRWSRVLFLWDQRLQAQGKELGVGVDPPLPDFVLSPGTPKGVEYARRKLSLSGVLEDPLRPTIQRELNSGAPAHSIVRHVAPLNSHGTSVTGCAAGRGAGPAGTPHVGAAPKSEIIFVAYRGEAETKLLADNTAVKDGCQYIFERARKLGRPCVVNLSLNDNLGPHDGTTLLEKALEGMLVGETGRAVTVSAGNANDTKSHMVGRVAHGGTQDIVLTYVQGVGHNSDAAEIWYAGSDLFEVTVLVKDLVVVGPLTPALLHPAVGIRTLPGGVVLTVISSLDDPRNGDNLISLLIEVVPGRSIPNLTIRLRGVNVPSMNGVFHAWVDRNNSNLSAWKDFVPDSGTIATPATAKLVIAVGGHDKTKPVPVIAAYSGRGLTRDGRQKPEIATTGGVNTAASDDRIVAPVPRGPGASAMDAPYGDQQGTSFAAPIVAGACALLFQCRGGTGGAADLLQDLEEAAGAAGPPNAFGSGFLQMELACAGVPGVPFWLRLDSTDVEFELPDRIPDLPPNPLWWLSPDVRVLLDERTFAENPMPAPSSSAGHRVLVTARNGSRKDLRDVAVELYWAELATGLTSLDDWSGEGVSMPRSAGNPRAGNRFVFDRLPAKSEAVVEFRWLPPAGDGSRPASGSFSLLARVGHASRPGRGNGQFAVGLGQAVALRSLVVRDLGANRGAAMDFLVRGSPGGTSLLVAPHGAKGELELRLPVTALPWRDREFLEKRRDRRSLVGEEIRNVTDVTGADQLSLDDGMVVLRAREGERLRIPDLRIVAGGRLPARIEMRNAALSGPRGFVHVSQVSDGRAAGGVSLELRRPAPGGPGDADP